jgi:cysteine desulfurase
MIAVSGDVGQRQFFGSRQLGTILQMETIYLDHNATTPTRPEVVEAMSRCGSAGYANPASQHRPGQQARRVLEEAREAIAEILDADLSPPRRDRLIFTSGGTEANNLAILGIARAAFVVPPLGGRDRLKPELQTTSQSPWGKGAGATVGRLVISAGEHQSVIEPAEHLLERGWRLDTLGLTPRGVVRVDQLPPLLAGDLPRLVSVQLGNHETGVLQPVAELAALCNQAGVPLHTDAVQVVGKLPVHFHALGVAAMSISAHKFQGPTGIGALLVRDGVPLAPLMFGGHQQEGFRPGTEPVALAIGMATALELWRKEQDECTRRLTALRDRFEQGLRVAMPKVVVHGASSKSGQVGQTFLSALPVGQTSLSATSTPSLARQFHCRPGDGSTTAIPTSGPRQTGMSAPPAPPVPPDPRLPQTSNVAFPGLDGEVLRMALDLKGVACSVGSACSSGSTELSPTLRAMELPNDLVTSSLRFSFGATTTEAEIDEAVRRIAHVCDELHP